jgi:hypothetical protein
MANQFFEYSLNYSELIASDVYAFGLILMEYFCDFKDLNAIKHAFCNLREKGELPEELIKYGGKLKDLVTTMTLRTHDFRPNIETVETFIRSMEFNNFKLT